MKDYDLVILDEPTSAMDEVSKNKAIKIIKDYAKGKTLIMLTHDLSKVNEIADFTIKMDCGKLVIYQMVKPSSWIYSVKLYQQV